jgi:hypothetical protein
MLFLGWFLLTCAVAVIAYGLGYRASVAMMRRRLAAHFLAPPIPRDNVSNDRVWN